MADRLKELQSKLQLAFTFNMKDLARLMNREGFLGNDTYERIVQTPSVFTDGDKTEWMVESLIKKVKLRPQNYDTFLELVRRDRNFGNVVDLLDSGE